MNKNFLNITHYKKNKMFSKYGILLVCCLIISITPASANQINCLENNIAYNNYDDTLEDDIACDNYDGGLETVILNTSYTEDIEQLHPKVNNYVDKIYGETFYTITAILLVFCIGNEIGLIPSYAAVAQIELIQVIAVLGPALLGGVLAGLWLLLVAVMNHMI